jgi:hypothetical protein
MGSRFLKDAVGWGLVLWLIGYGLGIALFTVVPAATIGWIILPVGTAIALWVLVRKVQAGSLAYYAAVGLTWAVIAVVCDYVFLVQAFKPADGYYKPDVYLYYALTLLLPLTIGWWRNARHR